MADMRGCPHKRPVGGNGVQARGFKRKHVFFLHFGRGITYKIRVFGSFRTFRIFVTARDLGIPAFAPRSGPPRTHAPGAQMIWVESGMTDSREVPVRRPPTPKHRASGCPSAPVAPASGGGSSRPDPWARLHKRIRTDWEHEAGSSVGGKLPLLPRMIPESIPKRHAPRATALRATARGLPPPPRWEKQQRASKTTCGRREIPGIGIIYEGARPLPFLPRAAACPRGRRGGRRARAPDAPASPAPRRARRRPRAGHRRRRAGASVKPARRRRTPAGSPGPWSPAGPPDSPPPPEDPRKKSVVPQALAGWCLWRAMHVPARLRKDRAQHSPKTCWNRSGPPRTPTGHRRRNRAPGDPGDPRGSSGAGQAPYGSREPGGGARPRRRWSVATASWARPSMPFHWGRPGSGLFPKRCWSPRNSD
eukprot:gene22398-biopygen11749